MPNTVEIVIPDLPGSGSASTAQREAVERLFGQTMDGTFTDAQAHQVLSARDYAQGIAAVLMRQGYRVTIDHEIIMIAKILSEAAIWQYVAKWSHDRFARGTHNSDPVLRRNQAFCLVVESILAT